jgi:hypothetical protein
VKYFEKFYLLIAYRAGIRIMFYGECSCGERLMEAALSRKNVVGI